MIIGLSGYARSGKNTVADMLGSDYRHLSFAQPMREALIKINPIIHYTQGLPSNVSALAETRLQFILDYMNWDNAKDEYPEVRRLLQVLGTEVGREMFGEDFWVDQAMKDVGYEDNVIFTDVRFPNEAWAIRGMGGEVWRVNRPGVGAVNGHTSETQLDNWNFDRVIDNDGTLDELREKVVTK